MDNKEFVCNTLFDINEDLFRELKERLLGEFFTFHIISEDDVTRQILLEKTCDYFEKIELKTGKNFEKQIDIFIADIDSVVGKRVAKEPQQHKNDKVILPVPRARKYYEKAISIKNDRKVSLKKLLDYTRIMLCLYAEIIRNKYNQIDNVDLSISSIDFDSIMDSMKTEQTGGAIGIGKKTKFDISDLYCSDTCSFIFLIIMYYYMKNNEVVGDDI